MVSACVPTMRFLWEKKELYSQATRAAGVANGSTYSSFLIKSNHLKVAGIMGKLAKLHQQILDPLLESTAVLHRACSGP